MDNACCGGFCGKCRGMKTLVVGVLMLINYFFWPKLTGLDGWIIFFAFLLVLSGIVHSMKSSCGHCEIEMPIKKKK